MIFIQKDTANPNISVYKQKRWNGLDGKKTTLAARDLAKAILHYANEENFKDNVKITKKSFTFEAYSHKDTKEELKKVFKSKCAYCESFIMHIEPGDIEHFRPKGEVHTKDGDKLIPGYYWLGADWNNLLLSCIKCNRSNNEAINILGGVVQNMGKANHFPLSDETKRVRTHTKGNISNEAPLILNPCIQDPSTHFVFEDNGQIKSLTEEGEKSIEVYGLFRADLVLRRGQASEKLEKTLRSLVQAVKILEELHNVGANIDDAILLLQIQKEKLDLIFHEDAEYLAMKRQKLQRFKTENPISDQRLRDLGIDLGDFF